MGSLNFIPSLLSHSLRTAIATLFPEITDTLPSSSGTYRWPWLRPPVPALTNSQRLAHPWKLEQKERNRQTQLHNDFLLSQQALYIASPNPTNQPPNPHLRCYSHPWTMTPTPPSSSSTPTVIQGMTSVSPTNDNSLTLTIIPGTPDQTFTGTSEQLPQTTTTDRELLALYNLFPSINLPETQPIHELTYAQMVRREYLWTHTRKRLKKKKNKRQPPSPILSPITIYGVPTAHGPRTQVFTISNSNGPG
jgi:hypothetical protein